MTIEFLTISGEFRVGDDMTATTDILGCPGEGTLEADSPGKTWETAHTWRSPYPTWCLELEQQWMRAGLKESN